MAVAAPAHGTRALHDRRRSVAKRWAGLGLTAAALLYGHASVAAGPLPQGGSFVGTTGSIAQNGRNLNVTQAGGRGIINWDSFSIGVGNTVSINNGTGATLNRVTGSDVSAIYGALNATGSVYLINPNGVLIGRTGVISTGGRFLASTLDVSDDSFLNPRAIGGTAYTGNSTANVVNLGRISSSGGDVLLISASKVVNAGKIDAPNGNAEFAVGRQVRLYDSAYQQLSVDVGSGGTIRNTGTVEAATINLQAADGNIFALAGRSGALRATGTATRDGHVWLVADTTTNYRVNTGNIDARGAQISARNADGSRGVVEMSGGSVKVGGADVQARQWNITTGDFTVDARTADTLGASLSRGASVNVLANGADGKLGANGKGNIDVEASLRWCGDASLNLNAAHSLTIAPRVTIANIGAGPLTLSADSYGFDNGGSVINQGTLDWSRSTGIITVLYDINGTFTRGTVVTNPSWQAAPFSGLLTQFTAYQLIASLDDLRAVNNNLAGNYALAPRGIEFVDAGEFGGIGSADHPFTGQFDGMGHLPADLHLAANAGMFNVIGKDGVVRNFSLADGTGTSSSGPVGLLAAVNYGTLINVGATGIITSTGNANSVIGGLVGENFGNIERSWAGVNITGTGELGGLVGRNDGHIDRSYSLNSMTAGAPSTFGGLVGTNNGDIVRSYAFAFQMSGGTTVGGLVGNNTGRIEQSYAYAKLTPDANATVGGIAGNNSGSIANDVFWNSESSGAQAGVGSGTAVASSSGLTDLELRDPASFGPTWDFGANGTWVAGYFGPSLNRLARP